MNIFLKSISLKPSTDIKYATSEELHSAEHLDNAVKNTGLSTKVTISKVDDSNINNIPKDSCTNKAYQCVNELAQVQTGYLQTLQDSLDLFKKYSRIADTFVFSDGNTMEPDKNLSSLVQNKLTEISKNIKNAYDNTSQTTRMIKSDLSCKYPDLAKSLKNYMSFKDNKAYYFDSMDNFEENATRAIAALKTQINGIEDVWSSYCRNHSEESLPQKLSGAKIESHHDLNYFHMDIQA
ncbi:MAG TPA: hypothetical protein VHO71_02270 [Caproiciproducens sp.]|nr:hypothetical protein [Caproiciproducens sp.]